LSNRVSVFAAALVSAALTAVVAQPAAANVIIYGSYTDSVSGVTQGDNAPTIDLSGGLRNTDYFNVDNLVKGGSAGKATTGGGLLFTVDPAACLNRCGASGTETATITVDFTFYNSAGKAWGTASDTATATFDYARGGGGTDNLCWSNSTVGGTAVVSSALVGNCGAPGSGAALTAYEQIEVDLGGQYYDVDLHDWNDWDETPQISFQWVNPPSKVPEPGTFAMIGAGLLCLGFVMVRRRRNVATQAV
jgi:hypothetical protein